MAQSRIDLAFASTRIETVRVALEALQQEAVHQEDDPVRVSIPADAIAFLLALVT